MSKINYLIGDATVPCVDSGTRIIAHICNDVGAWGAGFVLAISKKWDKPKKQYREWFEEFKQSVDAPLFALGRNQYVRIDDTLKVCNMIAQTGIRQNEYGVQPIRYTALYFCLNLLTEYILSMPPHRSCTVHMPRIGCGLAGGEWSEVEGIINDTLIENGIEVYVYDLPENK